MLVMPRLAAALMVVLLFAVPRFAAADDAHPYGRTPLTQKEKLRWNVVMGDGRLLANGEHWGEASAKFTEAIKLDPSPEAFLWKGYAEEQLGHLLIAKAIYAEAGTEAKTDNLPQFVKKSEAALALLAKKIPLIVLQLPTDVRSTVSIDGASIAVPPEGIEVNPGSRSLDVSAPGRESFHTRVKAEEGNVYRFDVVLKLLPLEPPAQPAPPLQGPRGCGACSVGSDAAALGPIALATIAALLLGVRRRARSRL